MDGGGERHVGPPRTLEIQNFAAARSVELQALYNAVKIRVEAAEGNTSSLIVARHLRRRTTSHNRRVPYWILNERKKKRQGPAWQQKRKITKKNNDFPGGGAAAGTECSEKRKAERSPPCRRVRRRMELQRVRRGEDIVQNDGTRRLATHVWHAKRFPMTKCWGYSLPEGLPGRGRGSRSVLKWVNEAAVLHDASYYGLIELQGSCNAIARSLQQTVEPSIWCPRYISDVEKAEGDGLLHGKSMLYHFERAPYDSIAPITFLWRTPTSGLNSGAMGSAQTQANVNPVEERQLWIWVHPGAYETALQCLSTACEKQARNNEPSPVKCRSRRGEFARLEISGSKATEVIRKVIHPTCRTFEIPRSEMTGLPPVHEGGTSIPSSSTDGQLWQPLNLRFFSKAEFLPPSAVLALNVLDPRSTLRSCPSIVKAEGTPGVNGTHSERLKDIHSASHTSGDDEASVDNQNQDGASGEIKDGAFVEKQEGASDKIQGMADEDEELTLRTRWWCLGDEGSLREVSDSEYLWNFQSGAKSGILAPTSEKKLCEKRHAERKKFLLEPALNSSNIDAKDELSTRSICPVLLLKSSTSMFGASGWTIVLPIKWAHAFWIPLVFAGGHVIGLRERHWIATNAGIPLFPHDFPDCSTYAQLLTADVSAANEANKKRPPAKRVPCFVVSPLQVSTMRVLEKNRNMKATDSFPMSCHPSNPESRNDGEGPTSKSQSLTDVADLTLTAARQSSTEQNIEDGDLAALAAESVCSEARLVDDHNAVTKPDGDSAMTDVEVLEVCSESTSLMSNADCPDDAVEGCATDGAVSAEVESVNVLLTSDVEPATGECDAVAVEDTLESDGICKSVAEEVRAADSGSDFTERISLPFFVARTQDVLLETYEEMGPQHEQGVSLLLHQPRNPAVREALRQEASARSDRHEAAWKLFLKGNSVRASNISNQDVCYVRVLVLVPRKGVLEEGAVMCSPFQEDRDAFLRSNDWHGPDTVQPKNAKRKRKCKGKKGKSLNADASQGIVEEVNDTYEKAEAFCEAWSNKRKSIGLITSSAPRGSTSPCIGICNLADLNKLRDAQMGEKKWRKRTEVFVLAGNKYSSKLRPALITVHLENATNDTEWM